MLLDSLAVSETDAVGHSMGGAIAIILAAERPDLVRRLVRAEPSLAPSYRKRVDGHIEDSFAGAGFSGTLAAVGPHWAANMRLADPHSLCRCERALGEALGLLQPRTLTIGDHTSLCAADQTAMAAGILLIRIANAGHNMMLDTSPDLVAVRG